jgi:hypothetical protein
MTEGIMANVNQTKSSKKGTTTAKPLSELLDTLPVELLLEIVAHLDSGIQEEPRSNATTTFLLALMNSNRRIRSSARPVYWNEVQLSTKSQVGSSCCLSLQVR